MKLLRLLLALFFTALPLRAVDVVVSIRYLRVTGKSHAALFLFNGAGKVLLKLTDPGAEQDYAPDFSPDGKEIVFHRGADEANATHYFIVDRAGKKTRPLPAGPPAWYPQRVVARPFREKDSLSEPAEESARAAERSYASPDGSLAIVLKPNPADEDHPLAFLREKKGPLQPFAEMPGFSIFWFLELNHGSPFLITPKLRVALFEGEHDSTLGTSAYALDVGRKRITTLSKNGAETYPWPGHDGLWVLASSRYEPLGDGRTVNCSYLDHYDATMQRTRFGHGLGSFGGASVFAAGEKVFTIPKFGMND
ncbi:MAG: hypothetical protein QOE70_3219 [Chthoniobacter sp.]|nr:hypothetical protein [Chthoniobacter sp.]